MARTGITRNIVVTGVGGQGVLTLAQIMAQAALNESNNVRVGEIHGMAQRGGHVVSFVRIGDGALGPIVDIGTGDVIIGFEPLETLREISLVRPGGHVVMNTHVQYPVAVSMGHDRYPSEAEIDRLMSPFGVEVTKVDAMTLAQKAGSPRAVNMVMFGAVLGLGLLPFGVGTARAVVRSAFGGRYEAINSAALDLGVAAVSGGS